MSLPVDQLYYPIGNTPPADVTLGCYVDKQCDILLLGGGDIRNILFTINSLTEIGTLPTKGRQLHFHLNDIEVSILSRNLVLLHVINIIDPSQSDDVKFLWCIWYDTLLSREHQNRLMSIITALTKDKPGVEGVVFGNESTETAVKDCLESWTTEARGSREVIESRRHFLSSEDERTPTDRVASRLVCQCHTFADDRNKDRYHQEVQEYTDVGTTRINTSRMSQRQVLEAYLPNVTFLPPGSKNWRVPIDSSPFLCFEIENDMERYDGSKYTVVNTCLEKLTKWVATFKQSVKACNINVTLWLDDAKRLCEETLPVDLTFDFIDTSNLADSLGLVSLLVLCRGRLKGESGVLRTEVFDWWRCLGEGEKYLRLCVDIPPLTYPTVLGFHLAEELQIGHERYLEMGDFEGCDKLVLRWRKAGAFTPCTRTEEDSVTSAIKALKSLTNPARVTNFPGVKSAHCDERTQAKALDRLEEVTTQIKSGERKVVEYNDRYEIEIPTEQDGACVLTVTAADFDKRLVYFKLSTGVVTKFKSELRFSCPVLVDMKKIKTSTGFIKGTLVKDKTNSVGERVLPWRRLTSDMISNLPDYPTSEYSTVMLNLRTQWVYLTDDASIAVDEDKPYPRLQLRDICIAFMQDPKIHRDRLFAVPRRKPKGFLPLDVYQSTVMLGQLKMFEDKPAMFLTVYNHDSAPLKTLLLGSNLSLMDLMSDVADIKPCRQLNDKLLDGYDMLKLILKLNSHRIQQNNDSCPWKMKSFLRMRYPFKISTAFELETKCMTRFKEDGKWKSPSSPFECMQMILDISDTAPLSKQQAILETAKASIGFLCDSCGQLTDCKKCAACNKVFYCSRSCQRRAWPQHKMHCSE